MKLGKVLLGIAMSTFLLFLVLAGVNFDGITLALIWTLIIVGVAWITAIIKSNNSVESYVKSVGGQPITEGFILDMVYTLAAKAGLENMPQIAWVNSKVINAFAIGTPKKSAIVFYAGIIENLSRDELSAIIGHEITHIVNNDCTTRIAVLTAIQGITYVILAPIYLAGYFMMWISPSAANMIAGLTNIAIKITGTLFGFVGQLSSLKYFREQEYAADVGAANLTSPELMASSLSKLDACIKNQQVENPVIAALCIYNPLSAFGEFFSTHPSIQNRIKALNRKDF